jgi:hypothetical protein
MLFISALDGWSMALFAGLCTVISLLFAEWIGTGIGAVITVAGVIELRGRMRLMRGDPSGMSGLIGAQLIILAIIVAYSLGNLFTYDEAALMAQIMPKIHDALARAGMSASDLNLQPMIKPVYFCLYLTVIGATLLFQGGLALYYHSRKTKVTAALLARQSLPPELPHA